MTLTFCDQRELAIRSIKLGRIDDAYVSMCCPLLSERGVQKVIQSTIRKSRVLFMALLANSIQLNQTERNISANMLRKLGPSSTQLAYNTVYEMAMTQ
ncbi:hypothetical protein SS50377_25187 [Spironucleus salmonicida]|uniref:Uncharacterized protein n=1 Tax=Spironucleus salmonicida TaxID=348837 RepID=V6LT26_9EUKA|nr:hypothetical protein SS50377_25187 [Spironucleus salmonicida]|eukprot:EST46846.1 Hypothetical protein SS50377_13110 [Spironucleus salmonicida]